jgi:hypothetical protein
MKIYGDRDLLMSLTKDELERLVAGRTIARGSEIYGLCGGCRRVIRANGWFGGWHVCDSE